MMVTTLSTSEPRGTERFKARGDGDCHDNEVEDVPGHRPKLEALSDAAPAAVEELLGRNRRLKTYSGNLQASLKPL